MSKGVEKTKELNEAYEILKDVNKRKEYDRNFFDYYPVKIENEKNQFLYSRKSINGLFNHYFYYVVLSL